MKRTTLQKDGSEEKNNKKGNPGKETSEKVNSGKEKI